MYGIFGGCTTAFHLFVRHPLAVGALSFLGISGLLQSQPMGPGQQFGVDAAITGIEQNLLAGDPSLSNRIARLESMYNSSKAEVTEQQVRYVLKATDACTDVNVKAVMNDPDMRRKAGWLFFLDKYARENKRKTEPISKIKKE